ncbi:hypothetical protein NDU88_003300 [Pleurodeles waltl]|uniref:Uncharacterized protein n=1 Tax=Pleurodeles waltl TaxID=8319 RepID=A0AAV7MR94_PLEWA|nr:hypothetical protein NDU88_003300 [Pleurodeles waltl]
MLGWVGWKEVYVAKDTYKTRGISGASSRAPKRQAVQGRWAGATAEAAAGAVASARDFGTHSFQIWMAMEAEHQGLTAAEIKHV